MNIATVIEFIESMVKSATVSNVDGAYGSGMASGTASFDILSFIKKPQVVLRIVSIVFAVIVFGCIYTEDLYESGKCALNDDRGACNFGITIGLIAFLFSVCFLIIDARFDNFSNVKTRKRAVIVDMGFSAAWSVMWLVCFLYMASAWGKTQDDVRVHAGVHSIQSAIAFAFFSIITWAMLGLLNFLRYRQGVSTIFSSSYEDTGSQNAGDYEAAGGNQSADDMYGGNQAPYNNNMKAGGDMGGYQERNF